MSDLNDWVLEVGGVLTPFGTESTDYPFATQVTMTEPKRTVQDGDHPNADGALMGRDVLRGFDLQFAARVLREYPVTEKPWMSALDLYGEFASRWRGDGVRLTPGAYATLRNLERSRMVYGRPRGIAPKFDRLRKGFVEFQMDFATISPDFYSTTEKSIVGSSAGVNEGNLPAWPIITVTGVGNMSVALQQSGSTLWTITAPSGAGGTLVIDTRPWARGALLNGGPANGMLRGSRLEDCRIPAGNFNIVASGGSSFSTKWRDTFASL